MRYLEAHPWIRILTRHDLLAPRGRFSTDLSPSLSIPKAEQALVENLLSGLTAATSPARALYENAWQAYLALDAPRSPSPPQLADLRKIYLGQVNALLVAARWAEEPHPVADCSQDINLDGHPECILASSEQLTLYDIESGSLTYAFARQNSSVHQWIAPSSQFSYGLSDPTSWQPDAGLLADPQVIPGAFHDRGPYQVILLPQQITFQSDQVSKKYQLLPNGLRVSIQSVEPLAMRVPLAVDPWLRFNPGWGQLYREQMLPHGLAWGIPYRFLVQVHSPNQFSFQAFTASRQLMRQPENPNLGYPAGHYTTFPLAVLEFNPAHQFQVEFTFLSPSR